jgi:hypothetical protein
VELSYVSVSFEQLESDKTAKVYAAASASFFFIITL